MILLLSLCTIKETAVGHMTVNLLLAVVLERAEPCCGDKAYLLNQAVLHVFCVTRSCEMDI